MSSTHNKTHSKKNQTTSTIMRLFSKYCDNNSTDSSTVLKVISKCDQNNTSDGSDVQRSFSKLEDVNNNKPDGSALKRIFSKYNSGQNNNNHNTDTANAVRRIFSKYNSGQNNNDHNTDTALAVRRIFSKYNNANGSAVQKLFSKYGDNKSTNGTPTSSVIHRVDKSIKSSLLNLIRKNINSSAEKVIIPVISKFPMLEFNPKIVCNKCENIWSSRVLQYINKQSRCPHHNKSKGYSRSQIEWICHIMELESVHIQCAISDAGEYKINGVGHVDGYCKENNTVYEYHGIFWHGHPNFYDANDINPVSKIAYGVLYDKTLKRDQKIRDKGYNLVVKWE